VEYSTDSVVSLISHIHTATAEFANKMLSRRCGFVSSQGFILYLLSNCEKMTMGELSRQINRNKSTTTVLVRKLCDEGLIRVEQDARDNRQKNISLTEKGKKFNGMTGEISQKLLSVCYENFSGEEKSALLSLLLKMNENIEKEI
jgi:DNA-binding MarR family transcriptional regulator